MEGNIIFADEVVGSCHRSQERGKAGTVILVAAARELLEETGLLLADSQPTPDAVAAARRALLAGENNFLGVAHELDLTFHTVRSAYFGRWITPRRFSRRYDTRFFLVDAHHVAKTVTPPDDELQELGWFTIEELRRLDLPNITRAVIEDLNEYLEAKERRSLDWAVPYYYFRAGSFERVLLK